MPGGRPLQFSSVDELIEDVKRLHAAGYEQRGNWSLPQMAYHLGKGIDELLHEPASLDSSPEQQALRPFLDQVAANGWPENKQFPSPPQIQPPEECPAVQVNTFIASLQKVSAYQGAHVTTMPFGPVETGQMKRFLLAHASHHLSFLVPKPLKPSIRHGLIYFDIHAALNDIAALRKGYVQGGNWTLPMIAWHLCSVMEKFQSPASVDAVQTPEQAAKFKGFYEAISLPGGSSKFNAPPASVPAPECDEPDVDRLVRNFELLRDFSSGRVDLGPFGATPIEMVRRLHLTHAAHHLSFLAPEEVREALNYTTEDDAIMDVKKLRAGCRQLGAWSLPQACWHLNATMRVRMRPGPFEPNTPEQDAMRPVVQSAVAVRRLPTGVTAPPFAVPPEDVPDAAIDEYIATLSELKSRLEPLAPHRIFGNMSVAEGRELNLLHCVHHMKRFIAN